MKGPESRFQAQSILLKERGKRQCELSASLGETYEPGSVYGAGGKEPEVYDEIYREPLGCALKPET